MWSGWGRQRRVWWRQEAPHTWAEGRDQDKARYEDRHFGFIHGSCCSHSWFPRGQLPTFGDSLSRTFLNGTSGPPLATLYLLIFNNRRTFSNFPLDCIQPPPFPERRCLLLPPCQLSPCCCLLRRPPWLALCGDGLQGSVA